MKKKLRTHLTLAYAVAGGLGLTALAQVSDQHFEPMLDWTPQQAEILSPMSIVELDDGHGGTVKAIRITEINLQIVNGLGATLRPGDVQLSRTRRARASDSLVGLVPSSVVAGARQDFRKLRKAAAELGLHGLEVLEGCFVVLLVNAASQFAR